MQAVPENRKAADAIDEPEPKRKAVHSPLMVAPAQPKPRAKKAKKLVVLEWKEEDGAPNAPPKSERVVGKRYTIAVNNVRIWNGEKWYCIHGLRITACQTCPGRPPSNLQLSHPHLISQWSPLNPPMNTIATSSHKDCEWVCELGHTWTASVTSRTNNVSGCPECYNIRRRVVDPEIKSQLQANTIRRDTTKTGDESERFVEELLKEQGHYAHVERIGNTGDKTDIVVQLHTGEMKSCQVKTLTLNKQRTDAYCFTNKVIYPNNMLIIMVSVDRTKFAAEFAGKINVKKLSLSFAADESKYSSIMFEDRKLFAARLAELIPLSMDMVSINTDMNNKELAMLDRLSRFCTSQGLVFTRNDSNGNAIDGFINCIPVQCKFSSVPHAGTATYDINCNKNAGRIGQHKIRQPYSIHDGFKWIIIEVGGTTNEPEKYLGQFCFIPVPALVKHGTLASDEVPGKTRCNVCAPDTKKIHHWSFPYWNQWSALLSPEEENEPTAKRRRLE